MVMLWLAIFSLLIELNFSGSELQTKGDRFYINRGLIYIFCDSEGPLIGFTFYHGVQTDAEDGGKYWFVRTF
jgi:hypothetical protein